jgi:hypothetical protein
MPRGHQRKNHTFEHYEIGRFDKLVAVVGDKGCRVGQVENKTLLRFTRRRYDETRGKRHKTRSRTGRGPGKCKAGRRFVEFCQTAIIFAKCGGAVQGVLVAD